MSEQRPGELERSMIEEIRERAEQVVDEALEAIRNPPKRQVCQRKKWCWRPAGHEGPCRGLH